MFTSNIRVSEKHDVSDFDFVMIIVDGRAVLNISKSPDLLESFTQHFQTFTQNGAETIGSSVDGNTLFMSEIRGE